MASPKQNRTAKDGDDLFGDGHHRHHHNKHNKPKIPTIPDLRFEYSYLRTIRPYVHLERVGHSVYAQQHHGSSAEDFLSDYEKVELSEEAGQRGDTDEQHLSVQQNSSTGPEEVVRVEWRKVIWVTTRDQLISPLLQGALWAIASYFLTPYSASLGSKLGHLIHGKPPSKEGNGVGWLRKWVKSLGLTSKAVEDSRR